MSPQDIFIWTLVVIVVVSFLVVWVASSAFIISVAVIANVKRFSKFLQQTWMGCVGGLIVVLGTQKNVHLTKFSEVTPVVLWILAVFAVGAFVYVVVIPLWEEKMMAIHEGGGRSRRGSTPAKAKRTE